MKNIHVLPTDKPNRLYLFEERLILGDLVTVVFKNSGAVNQNIYITSDEEIKEGDYVINSAALYVFQHYFAEGNLYKECKKIILTTDQDLIKDGVQAIDDEFLEWFVKNPSCESVDVDYRYDTNLQPILDSFGNKVLRIKIPTESENLSQIIIPKEFPKPNIIDNWLENNGDPEIAKQVEQEAKDLCEQETLEEAIKQELENHFFSNVSEIKQAEYFISFGAKWQQDQDNNKFSDEDIIKILIEYDYSSINECKLNSVGTIKKWFEKYKNK